MKKSRTVRPAAGVESPPPRRLPLIELLIDTETELFELAVRSGSRGAQGSVWRTDALCTARRPTRLGVVPAVAAEDAVDPGFRNRDAVLALEIPDDAGGAEG